MNNTPGSPETATNEPHRVDDQSNGGMYLSRPAVRQSASGDTAHIEILLHCVDKLQNVQEKNPKVYEDVMSLARSGLASQRRVDAFRAFEPYLRTLVVLGIAAFSFNVVKDLIASHAYQEAAAVASSGAISSAAVALFGSGKKKKEKSDSGK